MKSLIVKILLTLNTLIIIAMLMTGFAYVLDPRTWSYLAIAGYAFPFFSLANVAFTVVWAVVRKRCLLLPFVGFVACYVPMNKFFPLNLGKDAPEGSLKVMTFNTEQLGAKWEYTNDENVQVRRNMLKYIADSDCDVVCLQEVCVNKWVTMDIDSIIRPAMPYIEAKEWCGNKMMILSKHPITKCERIAYESEGNFTYAFYLDVEGRELIVVNNHLETNHFSVEEKANIGRMVKGGMEREEMHEKSRFVLRKLVDAATIRAPQADAVATFISMHAGRRMIVCGDFNDIPLSYANSTIAGNLTDCYTATANGPGFTYNKNGMFVRIDNIMCSPEFTPYACHVDKTCTDSDHYPMISWIKE